MPAATLNPHSLRLRLWAYQQRVLAERNTEQEAPTPPPTVMEWARRYRRLDGQAFTLDRFPPLEAIYADDHPHIVVIKPSQRGVSEWAINLTMFALELGADRWAPGKDGLNVAYIFPTKSALSDFSKERLAGLEHEHPHLASLFASGDYNDITFKQVGRSNLYLRGGWSEEALESFPADVLVLDEYDRLDPKAIALAQRRMNASVVRREVDISSPSIPGAGIHRRWLDSDQRVYRQQHGCGEWVEYDFLRDCHCNGEPREVWANGQLVGGWSGRHREEILRGHVALLCPACKQEVSDADRTSPGRWHALEPEVQGLRGYWIPALAFPFVNLTALAISSISEDPSELETFFRGDLGKPYSASGSRVDESMLHKLGASLPNGRLPGQQYYEPTMGVDVGSRFHYRATALGQDRRLYVVAMGSVGSWAELDNLMGRYSVASCVVDALPEQHAALAWAAKWNGRVLVAFYPTGATALKTDLFQVDEPHRLVRINRTMAMDGVYAVIARQGEVWPAAVHNDPEVIQHMTAPVRVTTKDQHGQERATWVHTQPDHGYHSSVYDRVARAVLRHKQTGSSDVAVGGERGPDQPRGGGHARRA